MALGIEQTDADRHMLDHRRQLHLAFAHRLADPAPFADIAEQHPDLMADALQRERVHLEPASTQPHRLLLEAPRLSGPRDLSIQFVPGRFQIGGHFAHAAPGDVDQPGVPGEGGIDLDEPVIIGMSVDVECHVDDAETLIDGFEQLPEPGLAAAQFHRHPRAQHRLPGAVADVLHQRQLVRRPCAWFGMMHGQDGLEIAFPHQRHADVRADAAVAIGTSLHLVQAGQRPRVVATERFAAAHRVADRIAERVQTMLAGQRRQASAAVLDLERKTLPGVIHFRIADPVHSQVAGQVLGGKGHHLARITDAANTILQRQQDGLVACVGAARIQHGTVSRVTRSKLWQGR